jgi:hypothetical protein
MVCPTLYNHDADHLAWIASSRALTPLDIIIENLSKPSVKPAETINEAIRQDLMVIDEPNQEPAYDWINPIKMSLENQPPSVDNTEVDLITHKSMIYHLIDGILFE